jgi:hypothetical protein
MTWCVLMLSLRLVSAAAGPGAPPTEDDAIRLKSRVFVPTPGVEGRLGRYLEERSAQNRVHVLVQFRTMPTSKDRRALERDLKVRLLDAIPERAFFAAMPPRRAVAGALVARRHGARWVGAIAPEDKVSPRLLREGVRTDARRPGGRAELVVEFFGDVAAESQERILRDRRAAIEARIVPLDGWRVQLDEKGILALAAEDAVKWIAEIPPRPTDANDGVRSVNGVDADAVLAPNPGGTLDNPYDLSGAGVTVGHFEASANPALTHQDFAGRIFAGDAKPPPSAPFPLCTRTVMHDESVLANGTFDAGEEIYVDMDDSGTVSKGDVRLTGPNKGVVDQDPSPPVPLVYFQTIKKNINDPTFATNVTMFEAFSDSSGDGTYTDGEPVYRKNGAAAPTQDEYIKLCVTVAEGDYRIIPAAGSGLAAGPVRPGDPDIATTICTFPLMPHMHATHTAGTLIGSGSQSAAEKVFLPPSTGQPWQWKGVAPGARLISYAGAPMYPPHLCQAAPGTLQAEPGPVAGDDYVQAAATGVTISSNSWVSTGSGCHQTWNDCYDNESRYHDVVTSGRTSGGTPPLIPPELAHRILVVAAAGNMDEEGKLRGPERYVDANGSGQYDDGEAIYLDHDDDGHVSSADVRLTDVSPYKAGSVVKASDSDAHAALSNFHMNERHLESDVDGDGIVDLNGRYDPDERIYRDMDGDGKVSVGDQLITPAGGSIQADLGKPLRQFKLWGNVFQPSTSKNTIAVGNINDADKSLSRSSSRGPTNDGRVKPDLASPGTMVTSTIPPNNLKFGYTTLSGTSMATPGVSGAAALLTEWYAKTCNAGAPPAPDTLRALLVHGAEDLPDIPNVPGVFTGPDFAFGYGRVRVKESVDLVPYHIRGTFDGTKPVDTYEITVPHATRPPPLKVTLVWDDVPAAPNAAPSPFGGLLVNDLDLLVTAPDGTRHTPWKLDSENPFAPATRSAISVADPDAKRKIAAARDHRNTVEQVVVDDAMPGVWKIHVSGKLAQPPQTYTLVSELIPPKLSACSLCILDPIACVLLDPSKWKTVDPHVYIHGWPWPPPPPEYLAAYVRSLVEKMTPEERRQARARLEALRSYFGVYVDEAQKAVGEAVK